MLQIRVDTRHHVAPGGGEPVDHGHTQSRVVHPAKGPHARIRQ